MQQRPHLLDEGAVQAFGNPVQLGGVMDGESTCSSSGCKVLIERVTQVFSPSIGAQDFDGSAVPLRARPSLKHSVGFERVTLGHEEVGGGEACCIVREGDEVASSTSGGCWRRSPHVGMYFITELLGLSADSKFWDWLPCGA